MPPKSPSPGFGFASAGLSRLGRGELVHSAKMLQLHKKAKAERKVV